MRQFLLDLYEIQKIDLSIREQEKRQDAVPARLRQLEQSVEDLRAQASKLTDERDAVVREAKSLDSVVQEENQKVRKWEARLNDIRNQREYQALSRETEGSKRANRDSEEKISELNKAREALDAQLDIVMQKLTSEEETCEAERGEVTEALEAMKSELVSERQRRDTLVPTIPKAVFRKYDAIRGRRMGVGLSPVVGGNCTGCNIRLPPQLYNILQRGDTIEQCPSCHRLIFWDQILPDKASGAQANS